MSTGRLFPSRYVVKDRHKTRQIFNVLDQTWNVKNSYRKFPAPNPVSLNRSDLNVLSSDDFVVAHKSNGVRYILLLGTYTSGPHPREFSVMIDRSRTVYQVQVVAERAYFQGTVFDGELMWEMHAGLIQPRHVFDVFDVVSVAGKSVADRTLLERYQITNTLLGIFDKDIVNDPRAWHRTATDMANQHKIVSLGNAHCMRFRAKGCMPLHEINVLIREQKSLPYSTDGFIFTPIKDPVRTGTHNRMFKWKKDHTGDWLLHGTRDTKGHDWDVRIFHLSNNRLADSTVEGLRAPGFSHVPVALMPNEELLNLLGEHNFSEDLEFQHVIECSCHLPSTEQQQQQQPLIEVEMLHTRPDKVVPNTDFVLERTLVNVKESVSIEELANLANKNK